MVMSATIACACCGVIAPRRGPTQKYCEKCSADRDLVRKKLWARANPPSEEVIAKKVEHLSRSAEMAKEAGRDANRRHTKAIHWDGFEPPDLLWHVGVAIPFSYAASKNHLFTMRSQGHVALRREARSIRDAITVKLRHALRGHHVAHNKVWIDILVQKPDHRGDAVNVVDLVCDGIKAAIPVDDRWYSIRRLDWQIVKSDPRLFIWVGQETADDAQVCSTCGQVKQLDAFNKRAGNRLGVDRICKDCRREGRKRAKAQRGSAPCS